MALQYIILNNHIITEFRKVDSTATNCENSNNQNSLVKKEFQIYFRYEKVVLNSLMFRIGEILG